MLTAQIQFWLSLTAMALMGPAVVVGADPAAKRLHADGIENLYQVTSNIFSGSQPAGSQAFVSLKKLGVKTIISVDGSKPDAESARTYGLHYIHLPFGYDGIPARRVAELVKAAQSQSGPVYLHCHHGLHRGPAAVAVICEATAGWTTNQAVAWLMLAGTSADYAGLYRSAIEFRPPETEVLARIVELPEIAPLSTLVETMVGVDQELDRLKFAQKAGWLGIPNQPDRTPAQAATILWENLRELGRADDTAKRPEDYRIKRAAAENAADAVRALLNDDKASSSARDAALQALGKSCAGCHELYRN